MGLELGTIFLKLAADASQMKAGTKEAIDALKKTQQEAQNTRQVISKAFAGQEVIRSFASLSQALGRVQGDFAKLGATVSNVFGSVGGAAMQGGKAGFILAGITAGIEAVITEYQGVKRVAEEAYEAMQAGARATAEEIAKIRGSVVDVEAMLLATNQAAGSGQSVAHHRRQRELANLRGEYAGQTDTIGRVERRIAGREQRIGELGGAGNLGNLPTKAAAELARLLSENEVDRGGLTGLRGQRDRTGAQIDKLTGEGALEESERARLAAEERREKAKTKREEDAARLKKANEAVASREWRRGIEMMFHQKDVDRGARLGALQAADHKAAVAAADFAARVEDATEKVQNFAGSLTGQVAKFIDAYRNRGRTTAQDGELSFAGEGGHVAKAALGIGTALSPQVGAIASGAAEGAAAGGPVGGVIGGLVAVMAQSKQVQHIVKLVGEMIQAVADSLGQLLEPFVPIIAVVTRLVPLLTDMIAPVFVTLEPALFALFTAVKFVAGVINGIAAGIKWVLAASKDGFILGAIEILSFLSETFWAEEIAQLQGMLSGQGSFTETVKAAFDKFDDLDFNQLKGEIDGATQELAGSVHNLPAGFKIASARLRAMDPEAGPGLTGGASGGSSAGGGGGRSTTGRLSLAAGSPVYLQIGSLALPGVTDVAGLIRELVEMARNSSVAQTGFPPGAGESTASSSGGDSILNAAANADLSFA